MKNILLSTLLCLSLTATAQVSVTLRQITPQTEYAATVLSHIGGRYKVSIVLRDDMPAEAFVIERRGTRLTITAGDGAGAIYGANRLVEEWHTEGSLDAIATISEAPEMTLRGACIGLQKTEYLPGHTVYEYPYTPDNFPWFYDRQLWLRYLDMLASDNMNTVYLWNGHPFASLVKLDDYPFAAEVDDATMALNRDMYTFITTEASRRGIKVIQMFYNIILSKPFADHYGLKTQDRNRPITPLISDYTRKSIAAFVEQYPNVGFLVCLGEAMSGIETDIEWMTKTIIPGIRDGLAAGGRTDTPPIILRSHDTDCPKVLEAALPLYPNIYTMSKYTGESLTTYEPRGPWAETHRQLAAAAPVHISNVHILANLEPWRWSSPLFTNRVVHAMHDVHGANGLHLYPQASYWDWPYTADRTANDERLLQIDRDWMWYEAWGRYAWRAERGDDSRYWTQRLADYYGTDSATARRILTAYDESGEIAPKLIRRFGITEGNRQTLLLGMKMSELVNPYKYTIYPGFYESCGPEGEKLIEYVERRWKGEQHIGEQPLTIVDECAAHGAAAVHALEGISVTKNAEEFARLLNDMRCYRAFAQSFRLKVLAAEQVLNYKWTQDTAYLHRAVPLLEESGRHWQELVTLTRHSYHYANSMQTSLRRIPVGGDDGRYKTWEEMQQVYDDELACLKANIAAMATSADDGTTTLTRALTHATDAVVTLPAGCRTTTLVKGAQLFEQRPELVDSVAPELEGLRALVLNRDTTRIRGAIVDVTTTEPVQMLVGFFIDDQTKFASPPRLETDATGNEYGQAEALITNAIAINGMPMVDIHSYHLPTGHHTLRLPKGIIMVAGFTTTDLPQRDAGLNGLSQEVDWLFM